jgi:hypothetical protein
MEYHLFLKFKITLKIVHLLIQVERRRRFNINDRIKDLARLLPKNGEL